MSTEVFLLTKINKARELRLPIWVRMYDIVLESYQFSDEYQTDYMIKFYNCSGRDQEKGRKVLLSKSGQIRLISDDKNRLGENINFLSSSELRKQLQKIWSETVSLEEVDRLENESMENPVFYSNSFILQSNTKVRQFGEDALEGKTIPFSKIVK